MPETLLGLIEEFHKRGADIAYAHRRGYRTVYWSYREIAETSRRFACELEKQHVNCGDRVLIWGENCAEWVVCMLGCMLRGAVAVPMDFIASADFARRVCQQIDVKLCICSRELAAGVEGYPVIFLEDIAGRVADFSSAVGELPQLKRESTLQIVFTSGTTAEPKGVVISHGNVLANLEPLKKEIDKYLRYERLVHPLRFLNLLPLSHVFGQFLGVFVPHLLGATVVFQNSLNPSEIMHAIKRERVSVLITVPRIMETLRDKIERDQESDGKLPWFCRQFKDAEDEHFVRRWWRFRSIHRRLGWKFWAFISGGAALEEDTERFWGRLGFAVIQGYGLTETTSLVSVNHPFRLGKGSIGKVLPGREIKVADNGEILVRGENIATGYFQGKELKPVSESEGWFHTGDVGALDETGNLYFKGRQKNVIVTSEGLKIYPGDLEAALRCFPEIRDCVVIGLEKNGNAEACAVLILRDRSLDPEELIKKGNASLADYQRIRRWFVWPEEDFPRTATQKPRINVIHQLVQSRIQGEGETVLPGSALVGLIERITGRKPANLSPEANLAADLNLSSLERVELLGALEDRLQVDLNESRFSSVTTVGELEQMLSQPVPQRTDYFYPRWTQRRLVGLIRNAVYYFLSWPATAILSWPRVRGKEHLRDLTGPALFIANHVTQVDIGFILWALPFRYRHRLAVAMLGEMLQAMRRPPGEMSFLKRRFEQLCYGLVVSLFNVFPLPQKTGFRESFAFAGESADRGYSILVFPEGQRTKNGSLAHFRAGVGLLANNLNLPVVPLKIEGLFELKKKKTIWIRPNAVTVTIGQVVRFAAGTDPRQIAEDLHKQMFELGATQ